MKTLLILNFIIPFVMILVGFMLKKCNFPYPGPHGSMKWKVSASGYNTPRSRTSQSHWGFAQQTAPGIFLTYGKYTLAVAAVCTAAGLFVPWELPVTVCYVLNFILLFSAFYATEKEIKKRFGN